MQEDTSTVPGRGADGCPRRALAVQQYSSVQHSTAVQQYSSTAVKRLVHMRVQRVQHSTAAYSRRTAHTAQPTSTAQYSLCECAKNISSTGMCVHMSCVVHVRLHVNVQVLFSFIVRILGVIFAPSHTHGSLAGMRGMRLLLPSRSRRVHVYAQVSLRPNSFGRRCCSRRWTSRRATASSPSHGSTLICRLSCSGC